MSSSRQSDSSLKSPTLKRPRHQSQRLSHKKDSDESIDSAATASTSSGKKAKSSKRNSSSEPNDVTASSSSGEEAMEWQRVVPRRKRPRGQSISKDDKPRTKRVEHTRSGSDCSNNASNPFLLLRYLGNAFPSYNLRNLVAQGEEGQLLKPRASSANETNSQSEEGRDYPSG